MGKKKTIKMDLSVKAVEKAIKQIEQYKQSLSSKLKIFVERLSEIGIQSVKATMMSVAPVDRGDFDCYPLYSERGDAIQGAVIVLHGDQVAFIEFSSGITFGTSGFEGLPNNPSYGQGMGMGTYPSDKGHWNDPEGWWYIGKYGQPVHTYGIRAYAPMYNADVEMRKQLKTIAKEVFGG